MRQHPIDEFVKNQVQLDTDSKRALYDNLWHLYDASQTDDETDHLYRLADRWAYWALGLLVLVAVLCWWVWR